MALHMPGNRLVAKAVASRTASSVPDAPSMTPGFSVDLLEDGIMESESTRLVRSGDTSMSTTVREANFSVKMVRELKFPDCMMLKE